MRRVKRIVIVKRRWGGLYNEEDYGRWIELREDRMIIGVIYYRVISDSSDMREDRYEEERIMLDLRSVEGTTIHDKIGEEDT